MKKFILLQSLIITALFSCATLDFKYSSDNAVQEIVTKYFDKEYHDYINTLDFTVARNERSVKKLFFDRGSYFGFALPSGQHTADTGFAGPWIVKQNGLEKISDSLLNPGIALKQGEALFYPEPIEVFSFSLPGRLVLVKKYEDVLLISDLEFVSAVRSRISLKVVSLTNEELLLCPVLEGSFGLDVKPSIKHSFLINLENSYSSFNIGLSSGSDKLSKIAKSFKDYIIVGNPEKVISEENFSFIFEHEDSNVETPLFIEDLIPSNSYWQDKIAKIENKVTVADSPQELIARRRAAVKCLQTLAVNYRAPNNGIKYGGTYPSTFFFRGLWAWDTWKQSYALAPYDTDAAKNGILSMFEYADDRGMVPDVVRVDSATNSYKDSKPPLAAWAVQKIFMESGDREFLEKMYKPLVKYHQWWYQDRDNDGNGLCEYGSTDGSLIGAKWESGMDNAVRFDGAMMVKNGEDAYSMNRESVDLNSFLYMEKKILAEISTELGKPEAAAEFEADARELQEKIAEAFYDSASGYFYDRELKSGRLIKVKGSEGWVPLFCGCASQQQAAAVVKNMLDERSFNTYVPLPTCDSSRAEFDVDGYWRGAIWVDSVYFGIQGMKNYGFNKEAGVLTEKVLEHLEGFMYSDMPIRENYNPLTGGGLRAYNFSWSAAHLLQLLTGE